MLLGSVLQDWIQKNKVRASIALSILALFSAYQNCAKAQFTTIEEASLGEPAGTVQDNPICDPALRPEDSEYRACLSPNQTLLRAIQRYSPICQENGTWSRVLSGPVDYALCPAVCNPNTRPSDRENVACPAPYGTEIKGLQLYTVFCSSSSHWSRTLMGSPDYAACSKTCDPNTRPGSTSPLPCPGNPSILSGIQNYNVMCLMNGMWSRTNGSMDYSMCPAICDPVKKPTDSEPAKCPTSSAMNAVQNYAVSCSAMGSWIRTPSTFDSSKCPMPPTCNPSTMPPTKETVGCPGNMGVKNSFLTYSVTCSGTNWVQSLISRDDSTCPKGCTTPPPANTSSKVSCPSPFSSQLLAKQSYKYVCNAATGKYDTVLNGGVDYSACPTGCPGTRPPEIKPLACPSGQAGTAYQRFNVVCNYSTGLFTSTPSSIDNSGCAAATCTAPKPSDFEPAACSSPFADRNDAKKKYSVTCVNGSWRRDLNGEVDTSSCPVNDCTGSPNPGTQKVVGSCPGGASGNIVQNCSLSCTGRTWSQISCAPADYAGCSCGPNATFNQATKACESIAECMHDDAKDHRTEPGRTQSCQYGPGGYIQVVQGYKIYFKYCEQGRWQDRIAEVGPICPVFSTPIADP